MVLGVLCLLSGILYLDRICMSAAVESIQQELGLSDTHMGLVGMAFTLSYGLFEFHTGRWGDMIGSRAVLTRISIWWSIFTALTGACTGLWSLLLVRFLFGAGEAGAFPNAARVLSRWFPDSERGRVQGVFLAASQIGGALAPLLAAVLIQAVGWRWTFVIFGGTGILWAVGFWLWFRDDPAEHPQTNAAEVEWIGKRASSGQVHESIPWKVVLTNPSIRSLAIIMAFASFNSYIYFYWFPKYLKAARAVENPTTAGLMASVVLSCSAVGTLFGGFIFDRYIRTGGINRRRMMGAAAFLFAAAMLFSALQTDNTWLAVVLTGISCLATQGTQPLWWSCSIGISGKHVGALFGVMNSFGTIGAMSSQFLVGALADWMGSNGYKGRAQWDLSFYIDVGVLLLAAVMWGTFRFVVVEEEPTDEADLDASG